MKGEVKNKRVNMGDRFFSSRSSISHLPSPLLLAFLLAVEAVFGAGSAEIRIPPIAKPPVLDGVIQPEEWQRATRIEGLTGRSPDEPDLLSAHAASVWVAADEEFLWIAMASTTPPGGRLLSRVAPVPNGRNARVFLDDAVEIAIAPEGGSEVFQLLLNARDAISGLVRDIGGTSRHWESGVISKSKVADDQWQLECKIPLRKISLTLEDLRKGIRLSIGRHWKQAQNTQGASHWENGDMDPKTMPRLTLDEHALAVQVRRVIDPETRNLGLELNVFNPHDTPVTVSLSAQAKPSQSAPAEMHRTLTLAAKESQTVPFGLSGGHDPAETIQVNLEVKGAAGEIFYRRAFAFRAEAPPSLWTVDADAMGKVDFRFAYFPSFDEMLVAVDFTALPGAKAIRGIALTLHNKKGALVAETKLTHLQDATTEAFWKLSPLPDDEYVVRAKLTGATELPVIERTFIRHHFPWEGSSLGRSAALVPPFTPLEVKDGVVKSVLREHQLAATGLWNQVQAAEKPLLAAPMRLEACRDGKDLAVTEDSWKVGQASNTRIETQHRFRIGALAATASTQWDMDGTMFWTLELPPNPDGELDELILVIPVREDIASLMHACTDGLRFNKAGVIPEGEGVVWKSTDAQRNRMAGNYVPYIWIGDELRGISVFGENDRGWVTKGEQPVQEIVRCDERVEIHCRLVNGPSRWNQPRTLRLGFLATPTKPMPEKWRTTFFGGKIPEDIRKMYGDRIRHITFIGSTGSYGSAIQAVEPAPRNNDFSIWEALGHARRTGEADLSIVEKWKKESIGIYEKSNPATELNYGLHVLRQQPKEVTVYTNPRGVRLDTPEGQTFIDEWLLSEFSSRKTRPLGGVHYDVDPGRSYQDWMMMLYDKMMDQFADHIYWDDVFLAGNFDRTSSEAYRMDNGRIAPASGLRNMRNLIRRTAILGVEKGRRPFNIAHMTNTAIAPILSYAQMIYSWEDKSGTSDFQDRWPMDYIRAETIGRQHGTVPVVMNLIRSQDKSPVPETIAAWVSRTATGVMLTHELRPNTTRPEYWEGLRPLLEFGYGMHGTAVHNYWEKDYPVRISGGDASSILLLKDNEALLTVCDYAEGGDRKILMDAEKLGRLIEVIRLGDPTPLSFEGSNFSFPLKKHDYATFQIKFAPLNNPQQ